MPDSPESQRVTAYLQTIERLEPDITPVDSDAALASIAISLKRIADSLESERFPNLICNAIWSALQDSKK